MPYIYCIGVGRGAVRLFHLGNNARQCQQCLATASGLVLPVMLMIAYFINVTVFFMLFIVSGTTLGEHENQRFSLSLRVVAVAAAVPAILVVGNDNGTAFHAGIAWTLSRTRTAGHCSTNKMKKELDFVGHARGATAAALGCVMDHFLVEERRRSDCCHCRRQVCSGLDGKRYDVTNKTYDVYGIWNTPTSAHTIARR